MVTITRPAVGDTFVRTATSHHRLAGSSHHHSTMTRNVVTALTSTGLHYRVDEVAVTSEEPGCYVYPVSGTLTWLGWEAAVERGEIRR
jgi:hypothetical protein